MVHVDRHTENGSRYNKVGMRESVVLRRGGKAVAYVEV